MKLTKDRNKKLLELQRKLNERTVVDIQFFFRKGKEKGKNINQTADGIISVLEAYFRGDFQEIIRTTMTEIIPCSSESVRMVRTDYKAPATVLHTQGEPA